MENEMQTQPNGSGDLIPTDILDQWEADRQSNADEGGWDVPTIKVDKEGFFLMPNGERSKTFKGVYLADQRINVCWLDPDADGPPDCSALDAMQGTATRTKIPHPWIEGEEVYVFGQCGSCFFNTFGSKGPDKNGKEQKGKFCNNRSNALIWVVSTPDNEEEHETPCFMSIAPGGLKNRVMGRPLGAPLFVNDIKNVIRNTRPHATTLCEFYLDLKTEGKKKWAVVRARVIGYANAMQARGEPAGEIDLIDYAKYKAAAEQFLTQMGRVEVDSDQT